MTLALLLFLLVSPVQAAKASPTAAPAVTPSPSPHKPDVSELLKPRSVEAVREKLDVIVNADWEENDFNFTNAVMVRAPYRLTNARMTDFPAWKELTDAIKKIEVDPKTGLVEVVGEAGGLKLHSWMKVEQKYKDEISYEIVRGDMTGFKIKAYLWDQAGKTMVVGKGVLPAAKTRFPQLVVFAFPTVVEFVLSTATKNFRKMIEADYNRQRVLR